MIFWLSPYNGHCKRHATSFAIHPNVEFWLTGRAAYVLSPALVLVAYVTTKVMDFGSFYRWGESPIPLSKCDFFTYRSYPHCSHIYGAFLSLMKQRLRERCISLRKTSKRGKWHKCRAPKSIRKCPRIDKEHSATKLVGHVILIMWLGMRSHATSGLNVLLMHWVVTLCYEILPVTWTQEPILNFHVLLVFSTSRIAKIMYFRSRNFSFVAQCYW